MQILILNWRDPKNPLSGGAELSLWHHAIYWKKQGADITWISALHKDSKNEELLEGIRIIRKGSHFTVHLWAWWYLMSQKISQPDIVVDSFHFIPFFTPLYLRKAKIIALINEVAGSIWFANLFFPLAFIGFLLEPYFFIPYKNIPFIVGSNSCKRDIMRVGIPSTHISVIHHGADREKVSENIQKEKRPTMLFLARISKDKGIEDAIRAYVYAKKQIPSLVFWIVGKEERKGILQNILKTVDIQKRKDIHYYGFVSKKEKFTLLKKAWILVHPSVKEGWGLTIIEAGSQSTPAIGYNVPGLQDSIQNNKTGILVQKNPNKMGKAIASLIEKRQHIAFGVQAEKWSRQFTWEKSGKESWAMLKASV